MPRLTITEVAAHIGVHKSTVSRQAKRHGLVGADGKVDLDQYTALRETSLDPALQTTGEPQTPAAALGRGVLADERRRKMAADAELAEIELGKAKGELLDAGRIAAEQEDLARIIRDRILLVPREVAADCARLGDDVAIEATITMALRRALDELSRRFAEDAVGRAA